MSAQWDFPIIEPLMEEIVERTGETTFFAEQIDGLFRFNPNVVFPIMRIGDKPNGIVFVNFQDATILK